MFYNFIKIFMENLQRALLVVPFITGVLQWFKQILPEKVRKFTRLISIGLGILFCFIYVGAMEITINPYMLILGGVFAGLSATGLYSGVSNAIEALK